MKRAECGQGAGYTILETMIFLAVSAAMFVSAMAFINGRQGRTEFSTAVRDFESSINDLANDVSNGYYANATAAGRPFYCSISGSAIAIKDDKTTDQQGSSQGCIFIGKAIQFRSSSTGDSQYVIMTLVGKQYKQGLVSYGDSASYADSGVKAVVNTGANGDTTPNAQATIRIGGGVTVGCVLYTDGSVPGTYSCEAPNTMTVVDTVAFMTTFQAANMTDDEIKAGNTSVNLVVPTQGLNPPTTQRTVQVAASDVNTYTDADGVSNIVKNPKGGVLVCLQSNGTDQHAWVSIGGESSRFSTNTIIAGGKC